VPADKKTETYLAYGKKLRGEVAFFSQRVEDNAFGQGGSASPEDDGGSIAEGADICSNVA